MPVESPSGARDPGLQAERTLLSWRRTSLAIGVASLVGWRLGSSARSEIVAGLGLAALATAVVVAVMAEARHATRCAPPEEMRRVPSGRLLLVVAFAVQVLGVGGVLILVSGRR
ncbi:DUF202 domain-containing protein [Nocardioides sp. L-11A]|uniref:DUF202 domain-containing protein n=1 Tax=Nocardioides sp. L-11A TaxID=3043848 RepID=UPI00249C2438|nr:DUF202 domain-containing protein [Nocardioides sp. L-11A]